MIGKVLMEGSETVKVRRDIKGEETVRTRWVYCCCLLCYAIEF